MTEGTAQPDYPADDRTVAGWVRCGLVAGTHSPAEALSALRTTDLRSRFPQDPAAHRSDLEALVQDVVAAHRAQQPAPSADARAFLAAARTMSQAGIVVSLGDEDDDERAGASALERALQLRGTGAMVSGCAFASRAALARMVLERQLVLGVCPLPEDRHSVMGAQIAQTLGLGHASSETVGPRVAEALVEAGLPGRWDGASLVTVDPIDFAAPVSD